jgi:hypothetical protein
MPLVVEPRSKPLAQAASDQRPHPRVFPFAIGSTPRRHPSNCGGRGVKRHDGGEGLGPAAAPPWEVTSSLGVDLIVSEM